LTRIVEQPPQACGHSKNLDFIRSVAVLLVVGRHVAGQIGYTHIGPIPLQLVGIFGVMLFFVLTAHVLMFSMEKIAKPGESVASAQKRFFIRRAFRIYPLSIFTVLSVFAISQTLSLHDFANVNMSELIANVFLVQNLTGAKDIIGPLWSLPIEVQMYLLLPTMYFLIANRSFWRMALIYGATAICAVAAFKIHLPDVLRFAPWFTPGIVAYWIVKKNPPRILPFFTIPAALTALLLLYAKLGQYSQTAAAYPICLLLGLIFPFVRESSAHLLNRASEETAKYSYGIYLTHVPAMYGCFLLDISTPLQILLTVALTFALSVISYRFIEHPMIVWGSRLTKRSPADPAKVSLTSASVK
jgi:peptidoglycan/LPS O-acetylase OafA/YrhL